MYAIVKSGGKQYRVERGQKLLVERIAAEQGAEVALEPILYRSEQPVFDKDGLAAVKVTARVLAHVRGEKLRVLKFKPKRGYKRRTGHRQQLTRIEVTDITTGKPKPAAKAVRAREEQAGARAKAGDTGERGAKAARAAKPATTAKAAGAAAKDRPARPQPARRKKDEDGS